MSRKRAAPVPAFNKRAPVAPVVTPTPNLPRAGDTTRDDPTVPPLRPATEEAITHASQRDAHGAFEDDAAPSRLDFELLKISHEKHEAIIRRLIQVLPTSAQSEIVALLDAEPYAYTVETTEA